MHAKTCLKVYNANIYIKIEKNKKKSQFISSKLGFSILEATLPFSKIILPKNIGKALC